MKHRQGYAVKYATLQKLNIQKIMDHEQSTAQMSKAASTETSPRQPPNQVQATNSRSFKSVQIGKELVDAEDMAQNGFIWVKSREF